MNSWRCGTRARRRLRLSASAFWTPPDARTRIHRVFLKVLRPLLARKNFCANDYPVFSLVAVRRGAVCRIARVAVRVCAKLARLQLRCHLTSSCDAGLEPGGVARVFQAAAAADPVMNSLDPAPHPPTLALHVTYCHSQNRSISGAVSLPQNGHGSRLSVIGFLMRRIRQIHPVRNWCCGLSVADNPAVSQQSCPHLVATIPMVDCEQHSRPVSWGGIDLAPLLACQLLFSARVPCGDCVCLPSF